MFDTITTETEEARNARMDAVVAELKAQAEERRERGEPVQRNSGRFNNSNWGNGF